MDPTTSQLDEVIDTNMLTTPLHPDLIPIKTEICEDPLNSQNNEFDDFDFEPFHENVFRTLSANFDNDSNIDQVNEAYSKLELCFIENNILSKTGMSKFTLSSDPSSLFLKYRDIDDAFVDMAISETGVKISNNQLKRKINLKPFKENIFSVNLNDPLRSDNEESNSKNGESDSDGFDESDLQIAGFQSENELSDHEISVIENVVQMLNKKELHILGLNENDIFACRSEDDLHNSLQQVQNYDNPIEETVRDVRVIVEKLPDSYSENNTEKHFTCLQDESISNIPSYRQVARKKTGGVVINNILNKDSEMNFREQKIIHQLSSKDGEFVPSVFEKMTRSGKRDLERVLAESTANLVIQKTTQLISEKIKELQTHDPSTENSSSEDEDDETERTKAVEMVSKTIMEFLSKSKCKKLEKLGKDITDEINKKVSNLKVGGEVGENVIKQPDPNQTDTSPSEVNQEENEKSEAEKEKLENLADGKITNIPDKENSFKNVSREIVNRRANLAKKKSINNKKVVPIGCQKVSNSSLKVLAKIEREIIEMDSIKDPDESPEVPRRPATRQSRSKHDLKLEEGTKIYLPDLPDARRVRTKRKSDSSNSKSNTTKSSNKQIEISNSNKDIADSLTGQLIDGQFLIDSELNNGDSSFDLNETDLSKKLNNVIDTEESKETKLLKDSKILKASADSTTSENSLIKIDTDTSNLNASPTEDAQLSEQTMKNMGIKDTKEPTDIDNLPQQNEFPNSNSNNIKSKRVDEGENLKIENNEIDNELESKPLVRILRSSTRNRRTSNSAKSGEDVVHTTDIKLGSDKESLLTDDNQIESDVVKHMKVPGEIISEDQIHQKKNVRDRSVSDETFNEQSVQNINDVSSESAVNTYFLRRRNVKQAIDCHSTSSQSSNVPSQVIDDIISNIEENDLKKKDSEIIMEEKVLSPKRKLSLESDNAFLTGQGIFKESSYHTLENVADSTSFLNYSMDDSFRLIIDEGSPTRTDEKETDLDKSILFKCPEGSKDDHLQRFKENNVLKLDPLSNVTKLGSVRGLLKEGKFGDDTLFKNGEEIEDISENKRRSEQKVSAEIQEEKKTECIEEISEETTEIKNATKLKEGPEVISVNVKSEKKLDIPNEKVEVKSNTAAKKLTNEEKIAQLTKRDPRLVNDKKMANVLMRDPRIRNKLPKVEEKLPLKIEENIPEKNEEKCLSKDEELLPKIEEKLLPKVDDKLSSKMQEKLPHKVQEKQPPKIQEKPTSKVQEKPPSKVQEKQSSKIQEKLPSKVPEKLPSKVPEKLPSKVEEKQQMKVENKEEKSHPNPVMLDNSLPVELSQSKNTIISNVEQPRKEEKIAELPSTSSKSELLDICDASRKRRLKKDVDDELLYKTPLSDLHDTNMDRPSYERNIKKKRSERPATVERIPSVKKERDPHEDRSIPPKRRTTFDESNEVRGRHNDPHEERLEDYYTRESFNDRNFTISHSEGERRHEKQYFGGNYEGRNFHPEEREQNYSTGSRENYENEGFVRRMHNEDHYSAVHDGVRRGDFQDQIYSRREFFRRNKYAHDHDHFSNSSRFVNVRQENKQPFYNQPDNLIAPVDSLFQVSSFTPAPLLPDPMYSQTEELDQSYGDMDVEAFSPPPSEICPPPPLIRSPTPDRLRREHFCPTPPRIGRECSPDHHGYDRNFHRNNYDRDERGVRGGRNNYNRDDRYTRSNYRHWSEESPPRKRFVAEHNRARDDNRGGEGVRWRRSPSWSPDRRDDRWSRERSYSPTHDGHPWDSPSPPRWREYRDRAPPPSKGYHRY